MQLKRRGICIFPVVHCIRASLPITISLFNIFKHTRILIASGSSGLLNYWIQTAEEALPTSILQSLIGVYYESMHLRSQDVLKRWQRTMFNQIAKMFRTAEKEAAAFQKTIAKEQRAYYKQIKKEETKQKLAEKKEFLSICADIQKMFHRQEPREKKQTGLALVPTIRQTACDFEIELGPLRIIDTGLMFVCLNGERIVQTLQDVYTEDPATFCDFVMEFFGITSNTFKKALLMRVRHLRYFQSYSDTDSQDNNEAISLTHILPGAKDNQFQYLSFNGRELRFQDIQQDLEHSAEHIALYKEHSRIYISVVEGNDYEGFKETHRFSIAANQTLRDFDKIIQLPCQEEDTDTAKEHYRFQQISTEDLCNAVNSYITIQSPRISHDLVRRMIQAMIA